MNDVTAAPDCEDAFERIEARPKLADRRHSPAGIVASDRRSAIRRKCSCACEL